MVNWILNSLLNQRKLNTAPVKGIRDMSDITLECLYNITNNYFHLNVFENYTRNQFDKEWYNGWVEEFNNQWR